MYTTHAYVVYTTCAHVVYTCSHWHVYYMHWLFVRRTLHALYCTKCMFARIRIGMYTTCTLHAHYMCTHVGPNSQCGFVSGAKCTLHAHYMYTTCAHIGSNSQCEFVSGALSEGDFEPVPTLVEIAKSLSTTSGMKKLHRQVCLLLATYYRLQTTDY